MSEFHQSLLLLNSYSAGNSLKTVVLSLSQCNSLKSALDSDGQRYLGNALLALSSGVNSIVSGYYGWAVVKLYYASFYAARARLAKNDYLMAYDNKTPYSLHLGVGEFPKKEKGQTHDAVLNLCMKVAGDAFYFGNNIDGKNPIVWLKDQRDLMNYKISIMPDPIPCECLKEVSADNIRTLIATYLDDKDGRYIFNPDHAMLAWTLRFVFSTLELYSKKGLILNQIAQDTTDFIASSFNDTKGPISVVKALFRA